MAKRANPQAPEGATLPGLTALAPTVAILPIGSFEQHGAHLPYHTDTLIAGLLGQALAQRLGALLVPPIPLSCSHEHAGFPYAVSLGSATLALVIRDAVASLERSGIRLTVVVNGHGGNYVLGNVAQELNQDAPRVLVLPTRQQWQASIEAAGIASGISEDMHGGEIETSLLLHAMPEQVRVAAIRDHEATSRPWLQLWGMRHYTEHGIIGFPSRASADKGQKLLHALADGMARDVRAILVRLDGGPTGDTC
ncbi:MAG: creatininase family protein [Pigmentiphaga sp.]|nr:creatininase family protein [Pigmentiphaga sp.]